MPDAPKNWRDIGSTPTPTPAAGAGRDWQQSAPTPSAPKNTRHVKLFTAGIVLFVLMMLIGIVVIWLRPLQPASLVLIGSDYDGNLSLPSNAAGWNGLLNLEKHVAEQDTLLAMRFPWDQPSKIRGIGPPIELKAGQSWKDVWKDIPAFNEKTLILFLSLHGVADKSDAYLLGNDPRAQTRIPFGDVLEGLKKLANKKVVVFLDVGEMESHWPSGMLHNDFAKRLKEKYDDKIQAMGNVLVVCAVSPDQKGWSADAWHNSVFSHYVAEGLKGAAAQSSNERITARRLFDYVEGKVDQWAQVNRARNQKPIMLGKPGLAETVELVHISAPYQEQAADVGQGFQPAMLEGDWKKWKELRDTAPYIHSPHLWRLYQDTLMQYEQLVRAGDPTGKAQSVKDRLKIIETKLDQAQPLEAAFDCLNLCFPMYQTLGYRPKIADAKVLALYDDLRRDIDEERPKLLAPSGPRDKQFLQAWFGKKLLNDQFEQIGKLDLADMRGWLKKMEVELGPREPVEVQLVKMLQDADPKFGDDVIKLALRTRIQAEEAALAVKSNQGDNGGKSDLATNSYPYSEAIFTWNQKKVEDADVFRREGEDLLFGDPLAFRDPAKKKLASAGDRYVAILDEAENLRHALKVRDEVASDLPRLATWLALAPSGGDTLAQTQDLRDAWPSLGKNLSDLNDALDSVKLPPSVEVALLTSRVEKAHMDLCKKYGEIAKSFANVAVQRNWHEINHALSIPPVDGDVELRIDLLRKLQKIAGELHAGAPKGPVEEPITAELDERQRVILEGLLKPYGGRETTGEAVRDFFLDLPDTIAKKSEGRAEDVAALLDAANLCRIVPAGLIDESKPFTAVDRLRRLRMHNLLMWQAERAWQDHWFEPGQRDSAYYLPVAETYARCARELIKADRSKDALLKEIDEFAGDKLKLGKLTSPAKEKQYWTTEQTFPLTWNLKVDGKLPQGTPMGWLQVDGQTSQRTALNFLSLKLEIRLDEAKTWPAADKEVKQRKATFHGLFRGQSLDWEVTLERPDPDVIVRQNPPPKLSGLAVRLSDFNFGAVSIVLDNSGSMTREPNSEKEGDKDKRNRRWDYAVKALEKVLGALPERTPISLCTFGPVPKEVDLNKTGIKRIQEPKALTAEERLGLIDKLWNAPDSDINFNSPVAAGIIDSMENGFVPDYPGPKVVLVLTDGDDNYSFANFWKQEVVNGKIEYVATAAATRHIQQELLNAHNKPRNREINVVVIGLIDETKAAERAKSTREQFEGVADFTPKSVFMLSKDPEKLAEIILDILQPRLELFENGKRVPNFKLENALNRLGSEAIYWTEVPPKTYQARFARDDFEVRLDPAQNLFMVLKRENRRYYLERGVLGEQPETKKAVIQKKGKRPDEWLVSLLGHDFDGNQLKQLIAFENLETKSSVVKQRNPGFVWLELKAGGEDLKDTLRWGNDPDVAAPAFRLDMASWPDIKAQPKLSAWFYPKERDDFLSEPHVYPMRVGKSIPKIDPKLKVVMESAQWENRADKKVFVIRVQHTPEKPVIIEFEDPPPPGVSVEHHIYRKPGRYTVVFSGLAEVRELNVVMIDLDTFKRQAERVVFPRNDDPLPDRITPPKSLLGPER